MAETELVVTHPFDDYAIGDVITHDDEVKAVRETHVAHVVAREKAKDTLLPSAKIEG